MEVGPLEDIGCCIVGVGGPRGGVAVGWEVRRGTRAEVGCELVA